MMKAFSDPADESGFTIIELLTVSVLLALLATILYSSITAVLNGREVVSAQRQVTLVAQFVLDTLGRDLVAREAIPLEVNDPSQSTPQGGSTFAGFGQRKFLLAENASDNEQATDSLRLVTQSQSSSILREKRNFGMLEVHYRLEKPPRDSVRIGSLRSYRLLREEVPAAVSEAKTRQAKRLTQVLADNITEFNLRYMLDGKWQDEWGAGAARAFPEAIEITLAFVDENETEHRYRTAIAVSKRVQTRSPLSATPPAPTNP